MVMVIDTKSNSVRTLGSLRWCLFSRRSCDNSKLLQTSSSLLFFPVHYIYYIWKQCGKPLQNIVHPEDYRRELKGNHLIPIDTDK